MKIIGVIPVRYGSARIHSKPLLDIGGKPMVWWVWNNARQSKELDEIYVATDDERIVEVCDRHGIQSILTSPDCDTPTDRVWEVSNSVKGDIYVFIAGDEPLITSGAISKVINTAVSAEDFFVVNGMTKISSPAEVIDFANIKMVCNDAGDGLYCSRSPLPYPRGSLDFDYMKLVGCCAMSKSALDFYVSTPRSKLEIIEECDLIRFIEHRKSLKFVDIGVKTLSVDTEKDIDIVRTLITPPPPKMPSY